MVRSSILIVEPDPQVTTLYQYVLAGAEYDITFASTLTEATAALQERGFALIVTEALDQESHLYLDPGFLDRFFSATPRTPVILCSTYAASIDVSPSRLGLTDAIGKPFDIEDLAQRIDRALRRQRTAATAA